MNYRILTTSVILATALAAAFAAEEKPPITEKAVTTEKPPVAENAPDEEKNSIKEAMRFAHKAPKGESKLSEKIIAGEASDEDVKKVLRFYRGMVNAKPPKGDEAAFKVRVTELVASLEAVKEKRPKAIARFKEAVNCKACHNEHRED